MKTPPLLYWCNIWFATSCVMSSNWLYDIEMPAQKMEPFDHGFWAIMIVNFYSNIKGKGCFSSWSYLFFFNDRLFPSLLNRKLNIIARANANDSFEKLFSERSILSKIKLTSVSSLIGTDLIWLAFSNLKLASLDWHFKCIACLADFIMFISDSKKFWAFWMLFWTGELKNTLNLLPANPLSNPGTLESKNSENWDTWVLHAMPWPSSISKYIASNSPTIKTVPWPANSGSLMYRMILFKTSSLIQVSFVEIYVDRV